MGFFGGGGNDIRIRFLADTSDVGKAVTETGSGISKGLGLASLGWAAAGAAAVTFGKQSIDAAIEAESANARLADSYAKFPALHDVSLQSLNDLADATLQKSRYDDEAARSSEALLAQFGLTGKQIIELLPLITDYAAKTGKELPDAAQAIGKALLGNTRSLKDVGIVYKSTGDLATDYANIVQLLTDKVGGFAAVDLDTPAGKLAAMKNHFGELQEAVGAALLPLLDYLAPALIFIFEVLAMSLKGWGLLFTEVGALATTVLQGIITAALWVVGAFNTVAGAFAWAGGVLSSVFGGAVSWVTGLLRDVWSVISDVAGAVGGVFAGAWNIAKGAIDGVASAIQWVMDRLHELKGVWSSVSGIISKIGGIIGLSAPVPPPGGSGAPTLALAGTGHARAVSGGALAGAAGLTVNVNVHGNVGDPNLIGRRVVDALAAYSRTNGPRALRTNTGLA